MRLKIIIAAIAALHASRVLALSTDREQPIEIQADRVTLDEKKKVSIYEGDVELVQGSLRVTANRIEVQRDNEVRRVIATGTPVTFRQQPDEGKEIHGQAQRVDYKAAKPSLELSGDAHLWQGEDEFSGPHIIYEGDTNVVRAGAQAEGAKGRVHAKILPRKKTEEPK